MSEPTPFELMRTSLVMRGLLTADFRLTDEGNAHAEQLIAVLCESKEPEDWSGRSVRRNFGSGVRA